MKARHIIISLWALCLACASCSQADISQSVPSSSGQVKIMYKVAGSSMSRADTEAGWDDGWNENKIERVDLFVFDENGSCHVHIAKTGSPLVNTTGNNYTPLETDQLTYEEVSESNYSYYMVANCTQLANKENITLDALKAEMIATPIEWNEKQESFVMDGIGKETTSDDGQTITLTFDLARAAVKVRLAVVNEKGEDITSQCEYRFFNYVLTGTSVLAGSEEYGAGIDQERESMTEAEENSFIPLKYEEEGKHQVVFYTYPNNWFDESKLSGEEDAWTIEDYTTQNPIIEEYQTYILLTAPYGEEGEVYHYKVPVNFATYENNDKLSFTDAELEKIRDLYRMKRNHIYDITARIDQRGGGLDLETQVHEWVDGGSIAINYADNFEGTLNVITQTPVTTGDGEAYAVVYGDNDKVATFTFRMTQPVAGTWTANLTNGSQFELTSATGTASGIGVGDTEDPNEGLVTFSVRPTQNFEPGVVRETELYITVMTVNGERMGEQIINPEGKNFPGTRTRIKIRQVSLDQWNGLQGQ